MIPEDELKHFEKGGWAPMVDFLFVIIIVFATIAITRNVVQDRELRLAQPLQQQKTTHQVQHNAVHVINLSINHLGRYKWLSNSNEIVFDSAKQLGERLISLRNQHRLPTQTDRVKILLYIDKTAPWQPIADAIFAVREAGYDVHPVYQSAKR